MFVADQAFRSRFLERRAHHFELVQVLAAQVDEGHGSVDRVGRDQRALDHRVRDAEHDLAVLERAGLGLVGVDGQVAGLRAVWPASG